MYIPKSAFNDTVRFIKKNSQSGSYFLFDIPNHVGSKIGRDIFNFTLSYLFNEGFSDTYSRAEFEGVLGRYNFSIEDVYELNDCYDDDLFKFKHLNPTQKHNTYFTSKLN